MADRQHGNLPPWHWLNHKQQFTGCGGQDASAPALYPVGAGQPLIIRDFVEPVWFK